MNRLGGILYGLLAVGFLLAGPILAERDGASSGASVLAAETVRDTGGTDASVFPELLAAGSNGESAGHGGEQGGSDGPPIWQQVLLQVLGFLALIFVYWQWVHPYVRRLHEDHRKKIRARDEELKERRAELDRREREIEEKFDNIEQEVRQRREDILARGETIKQETIEEAKAYAEEAIENARAEAERVHRRALLEMQNAMTESALVAIRRYFREEAGEDLHEQFQQQFLDSLENADSIEQFQRGAENGRFTESS